MRTVSASQCGAVAFEFAISMGFFLMLIGMIFELGITSQVKTRVVDEFSEILLEEARILALSKGVWINCEQRSKPIQGRVQTHMENQFPSLNPIVTLRVGSGTGGYLQVFGDLTVDGEGFTKVKKRIEVSHVVENSSLQCLRVAI